DDGLVGGGDELWLGDEGDRLAVPDDVADLVGGEHEVDRHEDRAQARGAPGDGREVRRVAAEQGDPVALRHAPVGEPRRHGGDEVVELTEGQPGVPVDDRGLTRKTGSAAAQHLPEAIGAGEVHLRRCHGRSLPRGGRQRKSPRVAETEMFPPVGTSTTTRSVPQLTGEDLSDTEGKGVPPRRRSFADHRRRDEGWPPSPLRHVGTCSWAPTGVVSRRWPRTDAAAATAMTRPTPPTRT